MATRNQQVQLWDAASAIHRYYEELFRPVATAFSLTTGQLKVLHTLLRYGALPVGALAEAVGMARTNMSSLCKKLCKQGFMLRHRGKRGDERQVLLELTPEGESAARQAEAQLDLAASILRNGELAPLADALAEIANSLSPVHTFDKKARKKLPDPSELFNMAKTLWGDKTKKELQHGKE